MKLLTPISSLALFAKQISGGNTVNHVTSMNDLELIMKAGLPADQQRKLLLQEADAILDEENQPGNQPGNHPGLRSGGFIPGVGFMLNNLQEYGCWCFFDEKHGQGRGNPVDVFDSHCMKYHHAVACAKREIELCDPYDTSYSITAKQAEDGSGNITYDCETGNDSCQEATCYAQSHFISLLLQEQLEHLKVPDYPSFSAWKNGGTFDNESCKIGGGSRPRDEMCCGTWKHNTKKLLRFGRHLSRACCENDDNGTFKTYDSNLATCCDDGSVRIHGTC